MTLGFFGFLQCGEFTIPDVAIFKSSVHLSVDDIEFDSIESPSSLSVCIKASKTDPYRQGITIYLVKTDADICPVMAMADYLSIRGTSSGPLFHLQQGEPLRRKKLVEIMQGALAAKGYDTTQYCGHSFRIGAATTAAKNGLQDNVIKLLGRWESSSYQLYIRTPRSELLAHTKCLAN